MLDAALASGDHRARVAPRPFAHHRVPSFDKRTSPAWVLVASSVLASVALHAPSARACGVGTPGGPAGLSTCTIPLDDEPTDASLRRRRAVARPVFRRWRLGAGYTEGWTTLTFSGERVADVRRRAVTAQLEFRATDRLSIQLAGGALLGGTLSMRSYEPDVFELYPGGVVGVTASFRLVDGLQGRPFVLLTAGIAMLRSGTHVQEGSRTPDRSFTAYDLRASAVVGRTFGGVFTPYLALRAFGGPIYWNYRGFDRTGTDLYHYQLGFGATVAIGSRVDAFAELSPVGEGAFSAGLGARF